MSLKNHYFYNESTCEFLPIEYDPLEQFIYNASIWILTGVILASIGIILLSTYIGTPSELALKAENQALLEQLDDTKKAIDKFDNELAKLAEADNELFRSVLGMEEISYDERLAGTGGADMYEEFDIYSQPTSEILKWTASKIDNLERRISIQKVSFEQIKSYYSENKEKLSHLPAIKPTGGILLSGFGVRTHPILKYRRMHYGADFRADLGSPVVATGDATVRFAGRNGTLGKVVVLNHGYGYETVYAHLSTIPDHIKSGTKVSRGELIAYSGNSGLSEGPHLHYEVHRNGKAIDPINYLFADITPEEFQMYKQISATENKSLD